MERDGLNESVAIYSGEQRQRNLLAAANRNTTTDSQVTQVRIDYDDWHVIRLLSSLLWPRKEEMSL